MVTVLSSLSQCPSPIQTMYVFRQLQVLPILCSVKSVYVVFLILQA